MREHSDVMDDYSTAVAALMVGAMLRWPESAELLEPVTARMAMRSKLDFGLAAAIANFSKGGSFGTATQTSAMA